MDASEYLHQAYRLDERIDLDMQELERLREMSVSISSPKFGERVDGTRNIDDASFVRCLEKISDLEDVIKAEVSLLVDLKKEIRVTIGSVTDANEQLVLRYRYLNAMTWPEIAGSMHANNSTVRRWHASALEHIVLPKYPIVLKVEQQ